MNVGIEREMVGIPKQFRDLAHRKSQLEQILSTVKLSWAFFYEEKGETYS